jgi:hypothetical protein
MKLLLLYLTVLSLSLTEARRSKYNTGATRSNTPGVLNVHIIAHTHDDV